MDSLQDMKYRPSAHPVEPVPKIWTNHRWIQSYQSCSFTAVDCASFGSFLPSWTLSIQWIHSSDSKPMEHRCFIIVGQCIRHRSAKISWTYSGCDSSSLFRCTYANVIHEPIFVRCFNDDSSLKPPHHLSHPNQIRMRLKLNCVRVNLNEGNLTSIVIKIIWRGKSTLTYQLCIMLLEKISSTKLLKTNVEPFQSWQPPCAESSQVLIQERLITRSTSANVYSFRELIAGRRLYKASSLPFGASISTDKF